MKAVVARGVLRLMALLPLPLVRAVGTLLGWLLALLPNELRHITRVNLERCLPEQSPGERERLVRRSLVETGRTFAELGPLWLWPAERVVGLVRQVSGWELVEAAQAAGRGIVLLSPHLGAWEVGSVYYAAHYPITALYRPLRMTEMDELVRTARQRNGAVLMPTDSSGVRALYRELAAGRTVGILPDQDPGRGAGVFAPFFGHPANTMVLVSRLAARSGATLFYCVPERIPGGYHLHYTAAPEAVSGSELEASVAALNSGVESWVRRLPAQYLWSYKRFKSRPEGEPGWY